MRPSITSFAALLAAVLFLGFGTVTSSGAVPLSPAGAPSGSTEYLPGLVEQVHGSHCGYRWGWYRGFVRRHAHPWFCSRGVIIGPVYRGRRIRRGRVIRRRPVVRTMRGSRRAIRSGGGARRAVRAGGRRR